MVDQLRHGGEGADGAAAQDQEDDEDVDTHGGGRVGALDHQHVHQGDLLSVEVAAPESQPVEDKVRVVLVLKVDSLARLLLQVGQLVGRQVGDPMYSALI